MKIEKPIGLGIVGIGRAGWGMHCTEIEGRQDKFRVVAACDVLPERRMRMKKRYGCRTYARVEDLARDPEVEVVDIASRSTEHVAHALIGLAAGKHVFLEKPIAVSYAEARRLKPAAAGAKGMLFVRHNRRFEPMFQHVREIVASGVLGDIYEIKLRRNGYQRRADWQTLMRCGGGQLLNWGPHIIDHALRLLESPVAELWGDLKNVAALGDAEDHLKIVLKGENGRVIDLEISGGSALGEPEYLVSGRKGALRGSGDELSLRYLDPALKFSRRRATPVTPPYGTGFGSAETLRWIEQTIKVAPKSRLDMTSLWDLMFSAIREKGTYPITLEESLDVMRVISAVRRGTAFDRS